MKTLTTTQARQNLYQLVDEANDHQISIHISGKRGNAVLVSEDDWRDIQETLYLLDIPGMRDSLVEGMKRPLEDCSAKLSW